MTDHTIVAVYDTAAHAEAVVNALVASNVPASAISRHSQEGSLSGTTMTPAPAAGRERGFWSSLFGAEPDHDTAVYDRSMAAGATVVSVKVPEEHHDPVAALMESHHPVDIDERAESYGVARTSTATSYATSGEMQAGAANTPAPLAAATASASARGDVIQLAEESLELGKRAVTGGTTRIRRYVVATPVQKDISLHSERVVVDRHPLAPTLPATEADFAEKTIEMTATDERAVASKAARVYEEVGLHKEAADRVETVKDTVRREDVEIIQEPAARTAAGTTRTTPPVKPLT